MNFPVTQYNREEIQAGAEIKELDTDLSQPGRNRDGLLAAIQKARSPAGQGNQPRLCHDLGDFFILERLEQTEEVLFRTENGAEEVGRDTVGQSHGVGDRWRARESPG